MKRFTIEFTFIEFGHTCRTTWSGTGRDRDDAISKARSWFGFDKDGIEVTGTKVLAEDE